MTKSAIVKLKDQPTSSLVRRARNVFEELSNRMSGEIEIAEVPEVLDSVKALKTVAESLYESARNKILPLLKEKGTKQESGTITMEVGGFVLEARAQRSGLDAKKVEALLRAKSLDPEKYMEKEVTVKFKLSQAGLGKALGSKKLTQAELDTCMMETSYALQSPKRIAEEQPEDEE